MAVSPTRHPFRPDYAVPPGATIADLLEERDMTQTELARRLGVSIKHANQVVNGVATLSPELALGLEKVFAVPAGFWLTREAHFRAAKARLVEDSELEKHIDWAESFPVRELKKAQRLPREAKGVELVRSLLGFLGVASPDLWTSRAAAYRKSQHHTSDQNALDAWLRVGEIEAGSIDCDPFDAKAFQQALIGVRPLTREDPAVWQPLVTTMLARAGVAFVITDTFTGTHAHGATRWLSPTKALLQLSLRYHWEDVFWFAFFHEAGHILLHRKKTVFIDGPAGKRTLTLDEHSRLEEEANRFAAQVLIPQEYESRLLDLDATDTAGILSFAHEVGVTPAIVVGRLQHEGLISYSVSREWKRQLHFVKP